MNPHASEEIRENARAKLVAMRSEDESWVAEQERLGPRGEQWVPDRKGSPGSTMLPDRNRWDGPIDYPSSEYSPEYLAKFGPTSTRKHILPGGGESVREEAQGLAAARAEALGSAKLSGIHTEAVPTPLSPEGYDEYRSDALRKSQEWGERTGMDPYPVQSDPMRSAEFRGLADSPPWDGMSMDVVQPPMLPPGAPDSVAPQRPENIPNIVQQDQRFNFADEYKKNLDNLVPADRGFNFEDAYNKNLAGLGADPRVAQMEALQAQIAGRSGPDWRPAAQLQFARGLMGGRTVGEGIRAGMEGAAPYMQAGALETSRQEGQALRDQLSALERMSASESERRREARDMTRFQYDQEKSEEAFKENVRQFNESLSVNKQNKALELALSQFREEMDISQFKSGEKRKTR